MKARLLLLALLLLVGVAAAPAAVVAPVAASSCQDDPVCVDYGHLKWCLTHFYDCTTVGP